LAGKVLDCGCLVGTYETYDGHVVVTVDARGALCADPTHKRHAILSVAESPTDAPSPRADVRTGSGRH
jgi:hypothetical protein